MATFVGCDWQGCHEVQTIRAAQNKWADGRLNFGWETRHGFELCPTHAQEILAMLRERVNLTVDDANEEDAAPA